MLYHSILVAFIYLMSLRNVGNEFEIGTKQSPKQRVMRQFEKLSLCITNTITYLTLKQVIPPTNIC